MKLFADAPLATRGEITPKLGFALVVLLALVWLIPFLWMVVAALRSIAEMFERYGEAYFRGGERRVISRLLDEALSDQRLGGRVIATGGGAFIDPATRALILDRGIAVWLDCDVETLLDRVGRNASRPLLRQGNPRETIVRLKVEREVSYREAPIHVQSRLGPHQRTVVAILKELEKWR